MVLENLDRTQWSVAEALAHVETVVRAHRAVEESRLPAASSRRSMLWGSPQDPEVKLNTEAREQLMVALRDGDLHAQGRYTEIRPYGYAGGPHGSGFGYHSADHSFIRSEQWRHGCYVNDALTGEAWEFVDIRVRRFMVLAIWPHYVPSLTVAAGSYTTPYLELMQQTVAEFGLTERNQEKKEVLLDWFLRQEVEGEPISKNLADAMATLIRLPSSQRGGAKRVEGPDLRKAM
jgi:hypothetical protein